MHICFSGDGFPFFYFTIQHSIYTYLFTFAYYNGSQVTSQGVLDLKPPLAGVSTGTGNSRAPNLSRCVAKDSDHLQEDLESS